MTGESREEKSADGRYRDHHTPRRYNIESYAANRDGLGLGLHSEFTARLPLTESRALDAAAH